MKSFMLLNKIIDRWQAPRYDTCVVCEMLPQEGLSNML